MANSMPSPLKQTEGLDSRMFVLILCFCISGLSLRGLTMDRGESEVNNAGFSRLWTTDPGHMSYMSKLVDNLSFDPLRIYMRRDDINCMDTGILPQASQWKSDGGPGAEKYGVSANKDNIWGYDTIKLGYEPEIRTMGFHCKQRRWKGNEFGSDLYADTMGGNLTTTKSKWKLNINFKGKWDISHDLDSETQIDEFGGPTHMENTPFPYHLPIHNFAVNRKFFGAHIEAAASNETEFTQFGIKGAQSGLLGCDGGFMHGNSKDECRITPQWMHDGWDMAVVKSDAGVINTYNDFKCNFKFDLEKAAKGDFTYTNDHERLSLTIGHFGGKYSNAMTQNNYFVYGIMGKDMRWEQVSATFMGGHRVILRGIGYEKPFNMFSEWGMTSDNVNVLDWMPYAPRSDVSEPAMKIMNTDRLGGPHHGMSPMFLYRCLANPRKNTVPEFLDGPDDPPLNATHGGDQYTNFKVLNATGLINLNHTKYSFAWNYKDEVYYRIDDPSFLANVVDCGSAELTEEGVVGATCKHKENVVDLFYELDMLMEALEKANARTIWATLTMLLWMHIFMGLALYSPPPKVLVVICNRWVLRIYMLCIWYWVYIKHVFDLRKRTWSWCYESFWHPKAGHQLFEYTKWYKADGGIPSSRAEGVDSQGFECKLVTQILAGRGNIAATNFWDEDFMLIYLTIACIFWKHNTSNRPENFGELLFTKNSKKNTRLARFHDVDRGLSFDHFSVRLFVVGFIGVIFPVRFFLILINTWISTSVEVGPYNGYIMANRTTPFNIPLLDLTPIRMARYIDDPNEIIAYMALGLCSIMLMTVYKGVATIKWEDIFEANKRYLVSVFIACVIYASGIVTGYGSGKGDQFLTQRHWSIRDYTIRLGRKVLCGADMRKRHMADQANSLDPKTKVLGFYTCTQADFEVLAEDLKRGMLTYFLIKLFAFPFWLKVMGELPLFIGRSNAITLEVFRYTMLYVMTLGPSSFLLLILSAKTTVRQQSTYFVNQNQNTGGRFRSSFRGIGRQEWFKANNPGITDYKGVAADFDNQKHNKITACRAANGHNGGCEWWNLVEQNRGGMVFASSNNPDAWALHLPRDNADKMMCNFDLTANRTHSFTTPYWDYYTDGTLGFQSTAMMPNFHYRQDYEELEDYKFKWPTSYWENPYMTLTYCLTQLASTAGFGDWPVSDPGTRFVASVYGLLLAVAFDTIFLNVWCSAIQDKIEEKSPYLQSSLAMAQSKTRSDEHLNHRVYRSQAYLNIQWEKWHGLNLISPESTELEIFPPAYQREFKYAVLHSLLESRKSTILSQMTPGQLRHLSEQLTYHTVFKGDSLFNSTIAQDFILIILNGQIFLESRQGEYVGSLESGHVHFEVESLVGSLPHCKIISHSPCSEVFMIPRAHYIDVINANEDLKSLTNEINCKTYQRSSDVAVLAAHTKSFHGLSAPVLCQKTYEIEDLGDVINYFTQSKHVAPAKQFQVDTDNIDAGAADVLKTALTYTSRSDKASENAFVRTKNRLLASGILSQKTVDFGDEDEALLNKVYQDLSVSKQFLVDNANNASDLKQTISRAGHAADLYPRDSNLHTNWVDPSKDGHEELSSSVPAGFFHPQHGFIETWNLISTLHSYFAFFLLTFQFGFADRSNAVFYYILNYVGLEGFWLAQWYVRSKTGVFDYSNVLVFDVQMIKNDYKNKLADKAAFKALIPYEIILYFALNWILFVWTELPDMYGFVDYFFIVRLLTKSMYNVRIMSAKFDKENENLFCQFKNNVLQYVLPLVLLIHTLACFIYYAACEGGDETCRPGSWAWMTFHQYKAGCTDTGVDHAPENNIFKRWVVSCYWIIKTITCFNNANILPYYNAAKIVSTVTMYIGMHFTNVVTALITTALISNIRKSVLLDFKSHLQLVQSQIKNLSVNLQERVLETKRLVYLTKGNLAAPGYFEPEDHLQSLDRVIIKGKTLEFLENYLPFFYQIPEVLGFRISMVANTYEYPTEQVILRAGQKSSHFFVLISGLVEVIDANNNTVGFYEAGQFFNFLASISHAESKYTIKTATVCSIVDLKYADVLAVLDEYPAWNFLRPECCGVDMAEKCRESMANVRITPKNVSADITHNGPQTEGHDGINPNGRGWMAWSAFNTLRVGVHAILALSMYSYFGFSNTKVNVMFYLCDVFAVINIVLNFKVQRQNTVTNMWPKTLDYSKQVYKEKCMMFDIVTMLPIELVMLGTGRPGFFIWNRVFQVRQANSMFNFIANSIDIPSKYNVLRWMFYQIVWAFIGSSVMFKIAQTPSTEAGAITLNLSNSTSDSLTDLTISKKSWIGQAYDNDIFNSDFNWNNPYDLFVLGIYYISDCVMLIGTGQMYPQTFTEKFFELIIELGGWFCVMIIAAEFACIQAMSDMLRGEMEHYYFQCRELLQNTCAELSHRNKLNITRAFEETWRLRAGEFADASMKGLPTPLAKELAHARYDSALGNAFARYPGELDKVITHAHVLATTPKTFVVRRNSLQEYGYFIKNGDFKITTADKKAFLVGQGDFFIPDKKAGRGMWSVGYGEVVVLPLDRLKDVKQDKNNFGLYNPSEEHQHSIRMQGNDADAYYLPSIAFVVCGLVCFMAEFYHFFVRPRNAYLANNDNNQTQTDAYLQLEKDGALSIAFYCERYIGALLVAIIMGVKVSFLLQRSRWVMFDFNECCALIGAIPPIFMAPSYAMCGWKIPFLFFYVLLMYGTYKSKADDLKQSIFLARFVNYLLVVTMGCVGFSVWFLSIVCPNGNCKTTSFVQDFSKYNPFSKRSIPELQLLNWRFLDDNGEQIGEISDMKVFIDMIHLTTSIFTTTGHGYITVKYPATMMAMVVMSFVGKYTMACALGLSNNAAGAARSASVAAYLSIRSKLKFTMGTLQTKKFAERYLTGYLDAIFLLNSCERIENTLSPNIVCSGVLKEFFYGFYRKCFADSLIFENISIPCLREIMSSATQIDTFYAGHVIQSAGVPTHGLILVRNGCVLVGGENGWVAVNGDVVFNEPLLGDNQIVKQSATAFARSEVVTIDLAKLMKIFEYYPADYELYQRNIQKCLTRKFII